MPFAPGFELILRAERLCGEGIRCHRPPRSHAEAADSARAWSRRWAPCFITDTDKLRHMSSRFCVTMHRQTSENVDWDVEHSPGTPGSRQGCAIPLNCPELRQRCTGLRPTAVAASTTRYPPALIGERQHRRQLPNPRPANAIEF